ncbi:flavin reductase family protein [Halotalea alkalilenta]|uniref:flavin reductase family protein n=1 Tax=Halotalea alkalilenta TaxID=376489 RepID=UPI000489776B|nr:flavin reductase family protein [Halotalea alkalilenta]
MGRPRKRAFPVENVRRYLEPGPILLLTSAYDGERDVMTLGWHTVMEFSPSLVGCVISRANHSHHLVRSSSQCVLNLPGEALLDTAVRIGNCSGSERDKFAEFGLSARAGSKVAAPRLLDCHACFECQLFDDALVERYDFFIFEVVAAQVIPGPPPRTFHYRGEGEFMLSGESVDRRALFEPWML